MASVLSAASTAGPIIPVKWPSACQNAARIHYCLNTQRQKQKGVTMANSPQQICNSSSSHGDMAINKKEGHPDNIGCTAAPDIDDADLIRSYCRTERTEVDIVIVGGGLAGLALGLALHERDFSTSLKVMVCEKHPNLRSDTATVIGIGPNGVTALEGIRSGLAKEIANLGTYSSILKYEVVREGKEVFPTGTKFSEGSYIGVRWKSVQECLAGHLDPHSIHGSHRLLLYKHTKGGVDAFFEVNDGTSTYLKIINTKLLIGADGIWSVVRKQMFGDEPRYLDMVDWNAVVYNPNCEVIEDDKKGEIYVRHEENGPTRFLMCNAGDYTLWILRKLDEDGSLARNLLRKSGKIGNPASKSRALQQLEGLDGWDLAKRVIQATREELIFERKIMDRLPLDKWSDEGHVLLIGDAAHAQFVGPGQGARTAFEDAHQLAIFLEEAKNYGFSEERVIAAIKRFEEVRIPRLRKMQEYAACSTYLPQFQPEWAKDKIRLQEMRNLGSEYIKWVESYPEKQQGDPDSVYFK